MTPAEIESKTNLWMTVNSDYLLEQEEKIKKEQELREEMIRNGIDPDKKKKIYKKKNKPNLQSNGTALEAIEKIVQEKKMSTKINYDVLKNLNMGLETPKKDEADVKFREEPVVESLTSVKSVENNRKSPPVLKRKSTNLANFATKKLKPDNRPKILEKPSIIKKDILHKDEPEQASLYDSEPVVESGPIIETGPVEPYEDVSFGF